MTKYEYKYEYRYKYKYKYKAKYEFKYNQCRYMDSIQKIPANIFVLKKSLKYEYYSVLRNHPNTNMITNQFEKSPE